MRTRDLLGKVIRMHADIVLTAMEVIIIPSLGTHPQSRPFLKSSQLRFPNEFSKDRDGGFHQFETNLGATAVDEPCLMQPWQVAGMRRFAE